MTADEELAGWGDLHKQAAVCEGMCPDCRIRMIPLVSSPGIIAGLCRACRTGWRAVPAGLEPGWYVRSFPPRGMP
jgi:hypothetical protein